LLPTEQNHDEQEIQRLKEELNFLRKENEKLEKINAALMYRMEEGDFNHHAYRTFEHSVQLSEKVNEKTEEIHAVMQKLEQSNTQLAKAHKETNKVKQRLNDAIESINQPMLLLDQHGSIVFFNRHFGTVWDNLEMTPSIGDNYFEIVQTAKHLGIIRRALPADAEGRSIYQLSSKRWYQLTIRRTQEGGKVILFNDITEVKLNETTRYEKVVQEKNKLLQNLIDNIDVGILLVDKVGDITFWNQTFLTQITLSQEELAACKNIYALQTLTKTTKLILDRMGPKTHIIRDDLVVDRQITRLPNGNTLYTFTNITSQYKYAQTLKQNENWIRMITDNVPALIAYIGPDNNFLYTNRGYRDWYGIGDEDFNNVPIERSHLRKVYPRLAQYIKRVNNGEVVSFQSEETNADGETGFLQKVYLPHFDECGEIIGHFVLATDISAQVQSQLDLEQAKNQLESNVAKRTFELNEANIALQEAMDSKSKFLAAVSHDLLQPLSAAILFNESLKDQVEGTAGAVVASLDNSLSDLEYLIRALIDTSKLDAGLVKPDKQSVNAHSMLQQLAEEFCHISKDFGVSFNFRFHDAFVHTDTALLSRVLRNLLINAMKYGAHSKVLFAARKANNYLKIMVYDQGVGISEEDQSIIFKEFSRLKNSFNYSQSLGLGLYIVDKMSNVLGHTVDVSSQEGVGSCFAISVPLAKFSGNKEQSDLSASIQHILPDTLQDKQIWLIDNDPNIRIAMQALFANWGVELQTFSGYGQCAAVMDGDFDSCDMLIIDYHLDDGENGLDIAKTLFEKYPALPMMICTANHSKELADEVDGLDIGLLHKPINPMTLKLTLTNLFRD
jgi:PAS domain S-box-containing protein